MKTSAEINNYPSWLVPIELAVKLKEIGFNEYCPFFVYPNDDEVFISGTVTVEEDWLDEDNCGEVIIDLSVIKCGKFNKLNFQTIPTWEQVFAWFRKKGLHSHIVTYCTNLNTHKTDSVNSESPVTFYKYYKGKDAIGTYFFEKRECNLTFSYSTFTSYESAREALINSLIEDYIKQKNEKERRNKTS